MSRPSLCMKLGVLAAEKQAGCKLAETEDKLEMHLSVTKAHQADAPAPQDKPGPTTGNLHMHLSWEAGRLEEKLRGSAEPIHRPATAPCPSYAIPDKLHTNLLRVQRKRY